MGLKFKKPSFAAGELSERMHDRDDLERYHIGLKTCRNFRVLKEGGLTKRSGLRFAGRTKFKDKTTRFVELERDADTVNALEFGEYYVRIWSNKANVLQVDGHLASEQLQLIDSAYVWTASGSGTDEWYLLSQFGGPPNIFGEPTSLTRSTPPSTELLITPGTIGSLAADEWGYGDNDELGFDTIYIRDATADPNDYTTNTYRYVIP